MKYCATCGKPIDEALNFCNSCGAQLRKEKDEKESVLSSLVIALIVVSVSGLGVLVGLMAILLDKLPNPEPAFIFAIFYLATLFGIAFMITRQISKLINAKLAGDGSQESRRTSKDEPMVQLPPKVTAQLEYKEPASVVDSTTRTLDEIKLHER